MNYVVSEKNANFTNTKENEDDKVRGNELFEL